jgi:hypothetical protein
MVRRLALVLLLASPCLQAAEALPPLPSTAPQPSVEKNEPLEDFFTVTIVSLPFTAFWCTLGALAIAGAQQGHFPPEVDQGLMVGAGSAALGLSVGIGLVSVTWK